MNPTKAYAQREFRRFLAAVGYSDSEWETVWALIDEMQRTARARGMSEIEMATIYDADALLDIYRETLKRRH